MKAASKAFSVAPTEILGNLIVVPFKPFLPQLKYIHFLFLFLLLIFLKQTNVRSTGLVPIAQPPGKRNFCFSIFSK
jgi:hypothetical protein